MKGRINGEGQHFFSDKTGDISNTISGQNYYPEYPKLLSIYPTEIVIVITPRRGGGQEFEGGLFFFFRNQI